MERAKRKLIRCIDATLDMLRAFLEVSGPSDTMHPHRCGEGQDGFDSTRGCGHIWDHPRVDSSPDHVHARNHICPKCGKGPWYYVAGSVMRGRMMGRL